MSEDGDVEAGAYNEGSGEDEATASGEADDPKAAAFAVGRARTARAVVSPTEAHGEGANGDLAVLAASGAPPPRGRRCHAAAKLPARCAPLPCCARRHAAAKLPSRCAPLPCCGRGQTAVKLPSRCAPLPCCRRRHAVAKLPARCAPLKCCA